MILSYPIRMNTSTGLQRDPDACYNCGKYPQDKHLQSNLFGISYLWFRIYIILAWKYFSLLWSFLKANANYKTHSGY